MRKLMEAIERINEDDLCSICKGQARPWDPYATQEGGAYRDCEACRGTGSESVRLNPPEDDLDEATEQNAPVNLPRGKKVILQVEESDYKRGLIIQAKEGGGYDIQYWREDPSNVVTAEVKVDGKSIKDDAKLVYLGFHPEKGDEIEEANGILPDRSGNDEFENIDTKSGDRNGPDWEYWAGGISPG